MDTVTDSNGQIFMDQIPIVIISYTGVINNGYHIIFFNVTSQSTNSKIKMIITAYKYTNSINMITVSSYPVTIFYIKQLFKKK